MQSDIWLTLFQKIPPAYRDHLAIITTVGMEVSIQAILRTEPQYLVIRGRQAGTTDTGRIFFIPFDQINLLCVQKPMKGAEVRAMYGEPPDTTDAEESLPDEELPSAAAIEGPDAAPPPAPVPPPAPAIEEPPKAPPPRLSKSELLARIRSRSQGAGNGSPSDQ